MSGEHNSYDLRLDDFAGKKIASVEISKGHGHASRCDRITFRFQDKGAIAFETEGDCCSQSWIEHSDIPKEISGAEVTAVKDVAKSEKWDDDEIELTRFYETRFKTTKGEIVLEYRNSSNGYYGGSLRRVEPDPVLVPNYFDRAPTNAITAEKVRAMRKERAIDYGEEREGFYAEVLAGLLAHPGVSSSAKAVIEAALET